MAIMRLNLFNKIKYRIVYCSHLHTKVYNVSYKSLIIPIKIMVFMYKESINIYFDLIISLRVHIIIYSTTLKLNIIRFINIIFINRHTDIIIASTFDIDLTLIKV